MRFRCAIFVAGCYSILLFLPSVTIGQTSGGFQVVFSRRVYKGSGPSFQEIWSWNPVSGALKALTQSARDHLGPKCENGKITFWSVGEDERGPKLWSFDPASGQERVINEHYDPAGSGPGKSSKDCGQHIQTGRLEACATSDEDLSLSRDGKQVGHWNIQTNTCPIDNHGTIGKCDTPIELLEFSPDAKWLLIGELGLETGSSGGQYDYYLIEISTMNLGKVASADQDDTLWVPGGDDLLYVTLRDLGGPLGGARSPRSIWVQQLMLFDAAKGTSTAITSGNTDNFDVSLCTR